MHHVLILGAGKIGSTIGFLLANSNDYKVYLADININTPQLKHLTKKVKHLNLVKLDAENPKNLTDFLKKHPVAAIASCLPYYRNASVMKVAKKLKINYLDLTEDTHSAEIAAELAAKSCAFIPQCGIAPGFIDIIANDIMRQFSTLDSVKLRVGALPISTTNSLHYSLTWSTDGLINEYGNPCQAIHNEKEVALLPLRDIEEIKIDGLTYEAFNTSGGIGTLVKTYLGRVRELNYKTIRYPGHCNKMRFLMNDLKLNHDRDTLKRILENSLPKTSQDVVIVYVSVSGRIENQYVEEHYVNKFYPKVMQGIRWSAIQLTTGSALCAILDIVLANPKKYKGLVRQEDFTLKEIATNRFGKYFTEGPR